ncbi:hypothetical protein M409DRAFT_15927 [Zasmidium cellare ATCC 36951]|uniref:Transcriptional coactivator p15 (PC4) C-terminal domain-containing protein n=1 Tax=Zasmidium cellare ATCC 36951 TaxID=1080233 RepID=A0A6A6D673_ZASCE|nr:uncharacterized protein M409DRAFT_15927 [Zasmidium cellare ATCC 36951]KAF2173649.1 hypothetical protein M409DRAFT_15927 [Zasmidium cellare ATCC 36951]
MAKGQSSCKRAAAEDYEDDGGFVEDAPKSKKSKNGASKPSAKSAKYEMQKDADGNEYWEISGKRRLQVSEFKGNTMIGIREFYEKDGEMLPGKKGISLNLDQFNAFIELLPQLEGVLTSKGIQVPRPKYDEASTKKSAAKDEDADEDSEDDEDSKPAVNSTGKLDKSKHKANHEATSDEDDE